MSMTKKDYVAIADVLHQTAVDYEIVEANGQTAQVFSSVVRRLSDTFASTNKQFRPQTFLTAVYQGTTEETP